jgi:hypothetical protein
VRWYRPIELVAYWLTYLLWNGLVKHILRGAFNAYSESAERDYRKTCEKLSLVDTDYLIFNEKGDAEKLRDFCRRVKAQ